MSDERRKAPLTAAVVDGVLQVQIGVETLAFCVEHHPDLCDPETGTCVVGVSDVDRFADEAVFILMSEDELGATIATRAIDEAIIRAVDSGSLALVDDES